MCLPMTLVVCAGASLSRAGVDVWLIMGVAVFVIPCLGLAVAWQQGYIHGM